MELQGVWVEKRGEEGKYEKEKEKDYNLRQNIGKTIILILTFNAVFFAKLAPLIHSKITMSESSPFAMKLTFPQLMVSHTQALPIQRNLNFCRMATKASSQFFQSTQYKMSQVKCKDLPRAGSSLHL